jgi:hypothetical protein
MKPPIFAVQPTGNEAQQYLHRARMFRRAATELVDYRNGEQFWPKYALLTHAIELALKAFAHHVGKASPPHPKQHDLRGWYDLAVQNGLAGDAAISAHIDVLNELHLTHYSRYPQHRSKPVPDASVIADGTVDYLIDTFTQSINPR